MGEGWTFAAVLQRMYERSSTGILEALGPDGETKIHLQDGKVVGVASTEGATWKLGEFLVESETVGAEELARLSRRAEKAGLPLEEILLRRRVLSRDILKRFVELDARETIFPLFRRTGITCRFDEAPPAPNPWMAPIPLPFFLKGAKRRGELWPRLLQRIPSDDLVLGKVEELVHQILGVAERGLLSVDGHVEEQGSAPRLVKDAIGGNERVVYYYVNGRKTVRQLAYASCLGEFETYAALVTLFDEGFVEIVREHGAGEARRRKRVVLPAAARALAYGSTAVFVAVLGLLRPGALASPEDLVAWMPPALERRVEAFARSRVERALDVYFVTEGRYPDDPGGVVEKMILDEEALRDADLDGYRAEGDPPREYSFHSAGLPGAGR